MKCRYSRKVFTIDWTIPPVVNLIIIPAGIVVITFLVYLNWVAPAAKPLSAKVVFALLLPAMCICLFGLAIGGISVWKHRNVKLVVNATGFMYIHEHYHRYIKYDEIKGINFKMLKYVWEVELLDESKVELSILRELTTNESFIRRVKRIVQKGHGSESPRRENKDSSIVPKCIAGESDTEEAFTIDIRSLLMSILCPVVAIMVAYWHFGVSRAVGIGIEECLSIMHASILDLTAAAKWKLAGGLAALLLHIMVICGVTWCMVLSFWGWGYLGVRVVLDNDGFLYIHGADERRVKYEEVKSISIEVLTRVWTIELLEGSKLKLPLLRGRKTKRVFNYMLLEKVDPALIK